MPKAIGRQKRAQIVASISEGATCNAVARKHSVSASTVSKIAREEGLSFERAKTKQATEAQQADLADRRAKLAAELISDAEKLRARIWSKMTYYHFEPGKQAGETYIEGDWREREQDEPSPLDQQRLITTAAIAIDKSRILEGVDGTEESRGALHRWFGELDEAD